jgi:hypothetical protein
VSPLRLRRDAVTWRVVAGDVHVSDRRNGTSFSARGAAATIWLHLVHGATFDALVRAVLDEYDVEHDRAVDDLHTFLDELDRRDLLERDGIDQRERTRR